jgi:hypothetical protein
MTKRRTKTATGEKTATDAADAVLFVRVPRELVERLDAHVEEERARTGYRTLARADVVRRLLDQGLRGGTRPA